MKEDLLKIINHYGVMPQLKYFQSEVFELNEAIIIYEDEKPHCDDEADEGYIKMLKKHIEEEFADVMVMLEQFKAHYNLDNENIIETMKFKINRQLERISNESN